MPKINKLLLVLVVIAAVLMIGVTLYEIFLKPPQDIGIVEIEQLNPYRGQDVLERIGAGEQLN